jgi:chromosome segregation ATPase
MTEEREVVVHQGTPGWIAPAVIVLGILAVVGLWIGWSATSRAQDTHQALTADMKTMRQGIDKDITLLQQRLATAESTNAELQGELSVVTKRLRLTQGELKKARDEAEQIRDDNAQKLAAMDTAVKGELATKASTDEVKAVSGEVSGVRTDLDTTKKDLQMARSELGTLIARNHEEIDTLRRLGERDYVEFSIEGRNKPQKVGSVTVELRGANPKRNQYTVAMVVNDLRVEKKNRTVNEPIFFYTRGTKQPLELVVNQVAKDKITGYLSIPKVNQAASSGN